MEVESECRSCRGTGLYRGMAEPEGVAVVCLSCRGTGCQVIKYTPFVARKARSDVETVRLSKGGFLLSCGPTGQSVTYMEFCSGKLPKPSGTGDGRRG